jgi:hypothetical protein
MTTLNNRVTGGKKRLDMAGSPLLWIAWHLSE